MECPECGSDNITPMEIEEDAGIVYCLCEECGCEFEEEA